MSANDRPPTWGLLTDLLERGDPAFVAELRRFTESDKLAPFAAEWYNDRRPAARRMLLAYLDQPLNAFGHKPLVKRIFKLAEEAGDDEVAARFMLAFDRCVRRMLTQRWVSGGTTATVARLPLASTMPEHSYAIHQVQQNPDKYRLFTVKTRNYLRRRAWRYFRVLGKADPARYRTLMADLLPQYTDEDCRDGLAFLDNWGLIHVLYHHSPALLSDPNGWTLTAGHTLANISPAPIYPEAWQTSPESLLGLLSAQARPIRLWAITLLRREHGEFLTKVPPATLVGWLGHASPEMVAFSVELLRGRPGGLGSLPLEQWLRLLESSPPEALERLIELLGDHLRTAAKAIGPALRLAKARPPALAALGFELLKSIEPADEAECRQLLLVRDAECETLRPEMVQWACGAVGKSAFFRPDFVLELLDARFADVRAVGQKWLDAEPRAGQDVTLWRRLMESPYDDVRLPLLDRLQTASAPQAAEDAPTLARQLWATVLLNVVRGGKRKPAAVKNVVGRLTGHPEEADSLLPVLAAAVRSVRGPEFRTGLVGLVRAVRARPELEPAVRLAFPELNLQPADLI